jgi:hypothetical protein
MGLLYFAIGGEGRETEAYGPGSEMSKSKDFSTLCSIYLYILDTGVLNSGH